MDIQLAQDLFSWVLKSSLTPKGFSWLALIGLCAVSTMCVLFSYGKKEKSCTQHFYLNSTHFLCSTKAVSSSCAYF